MKHLQLQVKLWLEEHQPVVLDGRVMTDPSILRYCGKYSQLMHIRNNVLKDIAVSTGVALTKSILHLWKSFLSALTRAQLGSGILLVKLDCISGRSIHVEVVLAGKPDQKAGGAAPAV